MQLYILENGSKDGPFDLITMIKKIRNHSVTAETMVFDEKNETPVPAGQHRKLQEVFRELEQETRTPHFSQGATYSFGKVMSVGWQFLQTNPVISLFTGVFLLTVIVMATLMHLLLPEPLRVLGYFVMIVLTFYLLSAYMMALLRMSHGQPVDILKILGRVGWYSQSLLVAASIVALLTLVGMVLLAIPGLFVLTIYIFTPLLIIEGDMEFWDAMEASRKAIMSRGTDMLGIIFGLVVINFISAMLIIPLLISLPITFGALCELYDEFFYH